MINRKNGLTAASLFAAAFLASIAFTSQASAQCVECAENPKSDPFTQGLISRPEPGATVPSVSSQAPRNAHAEMRGPQASHHVSSHHVRKSGREQR